ncbi:MAG: DNA glycosylase [Clostridia bacterium]|nr:DNA glycosylase [Clostridia bacterium]
MLKFVAKNNNLHISGVTNFSLSETLDCGQAFRWKEKEKGVWCGVARDKYLELELNDDTLILYNTSLLDYKAFWENYFDLKTDYGQIISKISNNPILKEAAKLGTGIRILRQDSWEALCSFIFSQNNNIERIKGIIERLCENFGENLGNGFYSFPTAQKIASLTVEDLEVLRSGFRAKYAIDAAKKIVSGEIDLEKIAKMPIDEARNELVKIYGVGEKVADCTLLFGMYRIDAFPRDVWIKRAMEKLFPEGLPKETEGCEGIVQQYLFYYARYKKLL